MSLILVVEDDPAILRGVSDNLRFEGHDVDTAADGYAALKRMRQSPVPDLVVLDIMLPGINGLDLVRRARAEGVVTPIVMLTARGEESERVLGLDVGADDYITKPFSVQELLARIRALLRRASALRGELDRISAGALHVDFLRYEAVANGASVALTRKEFALLRVLAGRCGEVVRRDALLEQVWGYDSEVTSRTVDNHVASLRAKIERDPRHPEHLLTVHGVGYRWVSEVFPDTVQTIP
jgi:DNA-binding response OmpR family regulator